MAMVKDYKESPAVLAWELGNELEWIPPGIKPNSNVWDAVNALAEAIHHEDDRPVLTVCGGLNWNLSTLVKRAPALNMIGLNGYGNLAEGPAWLEKHGFEKPFFVTEWGPTGFWQVPNTDFNLPIEENSTQKADQYRRRYEEIILAHPGRCLGSYVFLWRQHQERTHTWFGMFDEQWRESEAVDVMRRMWTGAWPEHRAPQVSSIMVDGQAASASLRVPPGSTHRAEIKSSVEGGNPLTYDWEIISENVDFGYGGHGEKKPPAAGKVLSPMGAEIEFAAPDAPGAYRLFATVYDEHNHFAYDNFPFLVEAEA
jgi:hypothetical protein